MKVKFIKPGPAYGWGYFKGAIADIPEDRVKELLDNGVVIEIKEEKPKQAEVKQAVVKSAKKR